MELMNSAAGNAGPKHGIVIFDSRYGNKERIERSFEKGLKQAGVEIVCTNAREASLESLKEYDLIAVGAPTERITASKSIKEFFENVKNIDLSGKLGFARDTRLPFPLYGSGAKFIESELKNSGLEIIMPRASPIVVSHKEEEGGIKLKEGEEKKFEQIGLQVGATLLKGRRILA